MAANYRNHSSGSMSDSMLEEGDFDLSRAIDLLTSRSTGTLISGNTTNKHRLTESDIKALEGSTLRNRPLVKYPSSSNLNLLECSNERNDCSDAMSLNYKSDYNRRGKIILICEADSHPFQTRTIVLPPNTDCKVGRLISKHRPSQSNAIFDCKVLSRNHATISFCSEERFWLRDNRSSNGTFINDRKLDAGSAELHFGDVIRFGVDVMERSKNEMHGCIKAYVELYLPDGTPVAPICPEKPPSSTYVTDGFISLEDLHQLNGYMADTSQRKEEFEFELQHAQNLLDSSRQDASQSWQALLSKDQALQRIHSLEQKLQILETDMSEQVLKAEIAKLKEEKTKYQQKAKETLENVQRECEELLRKLPKMDANVEESRNNHTVLCEGIFNTRGALQRANERLRLLEEEFDECRNKAEESHVKAQEEYEKCIDDLNEKLNEQDQQQESLQFQLDEIMQQDNESDDNENFDSTLKYTPKHIEGRRQSDYGSILMGPSSGYNRHHKFTVTLVQSNDDDDDDITYVKKSNEEEQKVDHDDDIELKQQTKAEENMEPILLSEADIHDAMQTLKRLKVNFNDLRDEIDEIFVSDNRNSYEEEAAAIADQTFQSIVNRYEQEQEEDFDDNGDDNGVDDDCDCSDNDQPLEDQVVELRARLSTTNLDVKKSVEELSLKRDNYQDKITELLEITENWKEVAATKATQVKLSGNASGDHVSCDSGVCMVDKMTETTVKSYANASTNTGRESYENPNEIETTTKMTQSQSAKENLEEELEAARFRSEKQDELLKIYKEKQASIDQENAKLRQDYLELQEHNMSDYAAFVQTIVPIIIVLFGVIVFCFLNYI